MSDGLNRRILIVFIINLSFALIEWFGGLWSNSLAIQSDAIHDFGDSLVLGLAFFFESWSSKQPTSKYTFGFRRLSIFSSVFTGAVLIIGSLYILYSSFDRISNPVEPLAGWMIVFAILGLTFNGAAAYFLGDHSHHHHGSHSHAHQQNHHQNILHWHLIEDVFGWAAVLVGSIFIYYFQWYFIDTLLSVLIAFFILYNAVRSLKPVFKILLQSTPDGVDLPELQKNIEKVEGVLGVHDLHFWSLDGNRHVMTLHAVVSSGASPADIRQVKKHIRQKLKSELGHIHATIEVEVAGQEDCGFLDCVDH